MLSSFIDKKNLLSTRRSHVTLQGGGYRDRIILYFSSDGAAVLGMLRAQWCAGLSFLCLEGKCREDSVAHKTNKGGLTPV